MENGNQSDASHTLQTLRAPQVNVMYVMDVVIMLNNNKPVEMDMMVILFSGTGAAHSHDLQCLLRQVRVCGFRREFPTTNSTVFQGSGG